MGWECWRCPNCKRLYPLETPYCPRCKIPQEKAEEVVKECWMCPGCKEWLEPSSYNCPFCGFSRPIPPEVKKTAMKSARKYFEAGYKYKAASILRWLGLKPDEIKQIFSKWKERAEIRPKEEALEDLGIFLKETKLSAKRNAIKKAREYFNRGEEEKAKSILQSWVKDSEIKQIFSKWKERAEIRPKEQAKLEKKFEEEFAPTIKKMTELPFGVKVRDKLGRLKFLTKEKAGKIKEKIPKRKSFYRCQWPACNKPAADRVFSPQGWIWLCEEHLGKIRKKPQLLKEPIFKPARAKIGPIPLKLLFLTILGAIGIFYFFTGFFGLLPSPQLPAQYSKTLSNSLCLIKCYLGSIWNPSEWMIAGGLGELCRRKCGLIEIEAERLGCVDCYEFNFLPTENFPYTNTLTTLRLIVKAEQKDYCLRIGGIKECKEIEPAKDVRFEVIDECGNTYECEGEVCAEQINAEDTPLEGYVDVWVPCKDRFWVGAKFSYNYTTRGFSYFTLRNPNYKGEITYYEPVSTPGPLKVTIATQQKSFVAKGGNIIPLVIRFLNEGKGKVKINHLNITQSNPVLKEDLSYALILIGCTPNLFEIEGEGEPRTNYTITPKKFALGEFSLESDESKDVVCKFEVSGNLANAITDKITQTFIMDVWYEYEIEKSILFAPEHGEWDCDLSRGNWKFYVDKDYEDEENPYLNNFACEGCVEYKRVNLPYSAEINEGKVSYFRKEFFSSKEVSKETKVKVLPENEIVCKLLNETWEETININSREIVDEYEECDITLNLLAGYQILACKVTPDQNQKIYFDLEPLDLEVC